MNLGADIYLDWPYRDSIARGVSKQQALVTLTCVPASCDSSRKSLHFSELPVQGGQSWVLRANAWCCPLANFQQRLTHHCYCVSNIQEKSILALENSMLFDPGSMQTGDKRTATVIGCVKACPLGTGAMAQELKCVPLLQRTQDLFPEAMAGGSQPPV